MGFNHLKRIGRARPGRSLAVALFLIPLALVLAGPIAAQDKAKRKVIVAIVPGAISGLIYLAREKGFFRDEGLDVHLQEHDIDFQAVNAMLQGKALFSTASEFVVTRKILLGEDLRILSSLSRADVYRLVVRRRDRLSGPKDLAGRTVGIRHASIAEFYLSRFLLFNGMAPGEVKVLEVPLNRAGKALASGEIDAFFLLDDSIDDLEPAISRDELLVLPGQQGIDLHWLLCSTAAGVENTAAVEGLLRAMAKAESLLQAERGKAFDTIRNALGLKEFDEKSYSFGLTLDQALVLSMEEQARWLIEHQLDSKGKVPNVLKYMHFDGLQSIKPEGVGIIH
jgi:ABC-type nitrate/sulfonate/bicarbonate transport system substrate-binding protein